MAYFGAYESAKAMVPRETMLVWFLEGGVRSGSAAGKATGKGKQVAEEAEEVVGTGERIVVALRRVVWLACR